MSVCVYACMYVMYGWVHACMHVCMCVCMYVYMYVCTRVCAQTPMFSDVVAADAGGALAGRRPNRLAGSVAGNYSEAIAASAGDLIAHKRPHRPATQSLRAVAAQPLRAFSDVVAAVAGETIACGEWRQPPSFSPKGSTSAQRSNRR